MEDHWEWNRKTQTWEKRTLFEGRASPMGEDDPPSAADAFAWLRAKQEAFESRLDVALRECDVRSRRRFKGAQT